MRLLLICFDNLGDLVFTSSLVAPLKARYPEASWTILCKDYAADIARAFAVDAEVIAADPWWSGSPGRKSGRVMEFLKAVARARRSRPDLTIVTSTNWRASAVAWLVGSPVRIGFDRPKSRWWLTHAVSMGEWSQTPITASLAMLLEPCGVTIDKANVPPTELKPDRSLVPASIMPTKDFVVLHPFAGDPRRCWPIKAWGQLAGWIRDAGYAVVWMGREEEVAIVTEANPDASSDFFMPRLNNGRLAVTLLVTSSAKCLVGHDSGPIHFAAAMDVPVLGLYLPSLYPQTVTKGHGAHAVIYRQNPRELQLGDVSRELKVLLALRD